MNEKKKKFSDFLSEATKEPVKRDLYWNDPGLFEQSDEWIKKIVEGKAKIDPPVTTNKD